MSRLRELIATADRRKSAGEKLNDAEKAELQRLFVGMARREAALYQVETA